MNFFGAVATLDGLRPLLLGSDAPRAALTSSMASLMPHDDLLVELALAGDEPKALARAQELVDADLGAVDLLVDQGGAVPLDASGTRRRRSGPVRASR